MIAKISIISLVAFGASLSIASAAPVARQPLVMEQGTANTVTLIAKKKPVHKVPKKTSATTAPSSTPAAGAPAPQGGPPPAATGGGY